MGNTPGGYEIPRTSGDPSPPPSVILIHPPVAKPCEAPAGIARLSCFLKGRGVKVRILDANLGGLLSLLQDSSTGPAASAADTWTKRALRHRSVHLALLKSHPAYRNLSGYQRAVADLERILQTNSISGGRLGLADYRDIRLSPVRSADLIAAAEKPEGNPFYGHFHKELSRAVEENSPSVAGFSLNYLSQALTTFAMIGFLKRRFPGVAVALGGGLVTSWLRGPLRANPFPDLVDRLVAGPGEYPLLQLLQNAKEPGGLPNPPEYGFFPMDHYLAPGIIVPYSSSTGCYWNKCLFCPERAEGNCYRPVAPEKAIGELGELVCRHRPLLIHFLDNAIPPRFMEEIAQNPPGAAWYGFARFTDHLADPDFGHSLRSSGCVLLQLGLESGDQGVLDQLEKGLDLELASRALRNLKNAGIATYVYLLFGTPAETIREARRTLDFTLRHREQMDYLNLALFNLPLFGPEAQKLVTEEFYEGDLSLYANFSHPHGWNRNLVRQFLDKEFKRHPAIARILRRDPPVFTSNHAPFFQMRQHGEHWD